MPAVRPFTKQQEVRAFHLVQQPLDREQQRTVRQRDGRIARHAPQRLIQHGPIVAPRPAMIGRGAIEQPAAVPAAAAPHGRVPSIRHHTIHTAIVASRKITPLPGGCAAFSISACGGPNSFPGVLRRGIKSGHRPTRNCRRTTGREVVVCRLADRRTMVRRHVGIARRPVPPKKRSCRNGLRSWRGVPACPPAASLRSRASPLRPAVCGADCLRQPRTRPGLHRPAARHERPAGRHDRSEKARA